MRNRKKNGRKKDPKEADFDAFENPVAEEPATASFESESKLSPTALASSGEKSPVHNSLSPKAKNLSPPVSVTLSDLLHHTNPQKCLLATRSITVLL